MTDRAFSFVTRAALLFVVSLGLMAVFADWMASDAPIVAQSNGTLVVLSAVVGPKPAETDWAVWPPVRFGPRTESTPLAAPSRTHPLGTDAMGRDVVAVIVHGARSVVLTTLVVLALAIAIGVVLGALAGYGPRLGDAILARAVELSGALPTLVLLALFRASSIVPSWLAFVAIVSLMRSLEVARLVRGEVLRVGGSDYVLAARALGGSGVGVVRRHVLPHVLGPVLISAAFTAATVVGLEAALTFLGLGQSADHASWGALLAQARRGVGVLPLATAGGAVLLTTLSLYAIAERLDDRICARRGGPTRV